MVFPRPFPPGEGIYIRNQYRMQSREALCNGNQYRMTPRRPSTTQINTEWTLEDHFRIDLIRKWSSQGQFLPEGGLCNGSQYRITPPATLYNRNQYRMTAQREPLQQKSIQNVIPGGPLQWKSIRNDPRPPSTAKINTE